MKGMGIKNNKVSPIWWMQNSNPCQQTAANKVLYCFKHLKAKKNCQIWYERIYILKANLHLFSSFSAFTRGKFVSLNFFFLILLVELSLTFKLLYTELHNQTFLYQKSFRLKPRRHNNQLIRVFIVKIRSSKVLHFWCYFI